MRHCFSVTILAAFALAVITLSLQAQSVWQPATSLPGIPSLNGVAFPEDHVVVAVGDSGTIIRSTDDGTTWLLQASTATDVAENDLQGISFGSRLTGTASGGNPLVVRTTDGGITWERQQNGVPSQLRMQRPFFVDEDFGVIAATDPMLLTRDGGDTWEEFFFPKGWAAKEDPAAQAFWMFDTSNGCALALTGHGFGGVVMQSQGTMYDWDIATTDTTLPSLLALTFVNRMQGFAVGVEGAIEVTHDGGSTWTAQQSGSTATLNDVAFADALNGVAVGNAGAILVTSDGGTTWRSEWSDTAYSFHGVAYHNGVALVVGRDGAGRGVVLRRVDGAGSVLPTITANNMQMRVFPNPATGSVVLHSVMSQRAHVKIMMADALGRELQVLHDNEVTEGNHTLSVNLSEYPVGICFVRIKIGTTTIMQQSIVVVR